jgi:hypothetical protein
MPRHGFILFDLRAGVVISLVVALAALALCPACFAGKNAGLAKVAVHVIPHGSRSCTKGFPAGIAACGDVIFTEAGADADCFPVFFDLVEYQGCEFGMSWPGLYSTVFTSCSDLTIGGITFSGDGVSHAWTTCQAGPVCMPGWAWIFDYGQVCVSGHPEHGSVYVSDCDGALDEPIANSCAGIGGTEGDDPCASGPICVVEPTDLDFGTVTLGDTPELSFTIKNAGDGDLDVNVTEACPDYEINAGGGASSIPGGDSLVVTVEFAPAAAGSSTCTVSTGTECADVVCVGEGEEAPVCSVTPDFLQFGALPVGQNKDLDFTIENTGGGTLVGTVAASCTDFTVYSGGGAFSLGAGESKPVTVRFSPTGPGPKTCLVTTGTACADVVCEGEGEALPSCLVDPTELDFGQVTVGDFTELSFTVYNTGGGDLDVDVTEGCDDYDITAGGGAQSIPGGDSLVVTVRFQPSGIGPAPCTVSVGGGCSDVDCTGEGTAIAVSVDIRPGECPNPVRPTLFFRVPVAVCGTAGFDATAIDPTTVRLHRAGSAGEAAPVGHTIDDVATPFPGTLCDCHNLDGDGFDDFVCRFRADHLGTELELDQVGGETVELTLTANLFGGEPVSGADCILVLDGLWWRIESGEGLAFAPGNLITAQASDVTIEFYVATDSHVALEIFDVQGRNLATLVDGVMEAGTHSVTWNVRTASGVKAPAGVYFARVRNAQGFDTRKIVVVR